jgi:hypothetical protein
MLHQSICLEVGILVGVVGDQLRGRHHQLTPQVGGQVDLDGGKRSQCEQDHPAQEEMGPGEEQECSQSGHTTVDRTGQVRYEVGSASKAFMQPGAQK